MLPRMPGDQSSPTPISDNHVHSEWSWDAELGSMLETCSQASTHGIATLAFTEHWDPTPTVIAPAAVPHLPETVRKHVSEAGLIRAPPLDVAGYARRLEECRERFPELRIRSGVELGEPHWWPDELSRLRSSGEFERV